MDYPIGGPWANPGDTEYDYTYGNVWTSHTLYGHGGAVAAQGKVTAVFKWDDPNTTFPGGKVNILVKSRALGQAKPQIAIELNPGTALMSSEYQPSDYESDSEPGQTVRELRGCQLFSQQVEPGATEVKQEITLSSIASATSTNGASVLVQANAALDNRSVWIDSPNIEDSYRRTMNGSYPIADYRFGALPVPFVTPMIHEIGAGVMDKRNSDLSIVVDCVAKLDESSGTWVAQGIYHANTPNFTTSSPLFTWQWLGGDVTAGDMQDKLNSGDRTINVAPYSGPFYDLNGIVLGGNTKGEGMLSASQLTLTAEDSDGIIGKNTYTIRWYLPYEKLVHLPDGRISNDLYWVCDHAIDDGYGIGIDIVPAKEFDYMSAIDNVMVLAKEFPIGNDADEIYKLFKAVKSISEWKETTESINTTESTMISTVGLFRQTIIERPWNVEGMTPELREILMAKTDEQLAIDWGAYDTFSGRVRVHHSDNDLADQYDIHGFHSPNHILSFDKTDRYEWQNFYKLHVSTPVPPATGDSEAPYSYNAS